MKKKIVKFSTKAGTLEAVSGLIQCARVAPLYYFTVGSWKKNRHLVLSEIKARFPADSLVVRSSAHNEDTTQGSNAGAYLSILDVGQTNVEVSIEKVILSYGEAKDEDEVLIQPMLIDVFRSGVAFSHDPNTCAPYRVINSIDGSDTAAVTGGLGGSVRFQSPGFDGSYKGEFDKIIKLIEELLELFDGTPIDCEFALSNEGSLEVLWLLQVRPLILQAPPETEENHINQLNLIEKKLQNSFKSHPFLMGQQTVYGIMPDWNPAEIIGVRPKPLSLSLYRELITDNIWAYQRHNYGYRNLRSFPLMLSFQGLPYIDVRVSFNSFIPADLNEDLAEKLANYYIDSLKSKPELHDKIEFEIVFSCYTLDLPQRLDSLKKAGFSKDECSEIETSLRNLTNKIIAQDGGLWQKDEAKLDMLNSRRVILENSELNDVERIYWLLEDCKRYGTLPFAGLARFGFISIQLLKSLVSLGVITTEEQDSFLRDVNTVGSSMVIDRANMSKDDFLHKYGHLRPGTYDILSERYDENPDFYFDWSKPLEPLETEPQFSLNLNQMREINKLLKADGINAEPVEFLDFIKTGVELRELAKFHFTKNLSDILKIITQIGKEYGFSREQLAFCDINVFKELYIGAEDPASKINNSIKTGEQNYRQALKIVLPPVISNPSNIWNFAVPESTPNYITQLNVTAEVVELSSSESFEGKIVCIPNADPGFDWIFSRNIAGLITTWGGANSHMAIRAGELGLPAIIGAGNKMYEIWSSAKILSINCAARRVEIIS